MQTTFTIAKQNKRKSKKRIKERKDREVSVNMHILINSLYYCV